MAGLPGCDAGVERLANGVLGEDIASDDPFLGISKVSESLVSLGMPWKVPNAIQGIPRRGLHCIGFDLGPGLWECIAMPGGYITMP